MQTPRSNTIRDKPSTVYSADKTKNKEGATEDNLRSLGSDPRLENVTLGNALMQQHMVKCKKAYGTKTPEPIDYATNKTMSNIRDKLLEKGLGILKEDGMLKLLREIPIEVRERLAYDNGISAIYIHEEADSLKEDEEAAILKAAPIKDLSKLNGLNLGAGGRHIRGTLPIDAHRSSATFDLPKEQDNVHGTFLGWSDKLPFANNSVDFIVSTHNFEHLANPPKTMNHYLDLLKPGGGIGIVIPNIDYIWDARKDTNSWGHRWATRPETVCAMYEVFWKDRAELVQLGTLKNRVSFDFVLRKHGKYVPFESDSSPTYPTGKQLNESGNFWG